MSSCAFREWLMPAFWDCTSTTSRAILTRRWRRRNQRSSRERAKADQRRDHRGSGAASRRRLFGCRTPADGRQHRRPDRARDQAARARGCRQGLGARHALRSEASRLDADRSRDLSGRATARAPALPARDIDIAFAPVTHLVALDPGRRAHLASPDRDLSRKDRAASARSSNASPWRHPSLRASRRERADRLLAEGIYLGPLAWHSLGRQGPSRHRGHRDRLGRRALSRARPRRATRPW